MDLDDGNETELQPQPTADELKERHAQAQKILGWIKAEGLDDESPMVLQAQRQVDEAYAAWQSVKPRTAPSLRTQWAEKALLRTRRQAAKMEQSIDELDRWYEEERLSRTQQLNECRQRARGYEDKLAEITREAAEDYGEPEDNSINDEALQYAAQSIRADIGPALEKLCAAVPEGTEMHQQLAGTLAAVTTLYSAVEQAAARGSADRFDIAGSEAGEWHDQPWQVHHGEWSQGGWNGDWNYWEDCYYSQADDEQRNMDTGDVQVPYWMRDPNAQPNDHGERSWKRWRKQYEHAGGTQGRVLAGAGADNAEATHEHELAARAQAELQDAASAAAGAAGGAAAAAAADDAAADALQARREAVLQQAVKDGVDVNAGALANMDAAALERWAKDNLL